MCVLSMPCACVIHERVDPIDPNALSFYFFLEYAIRRELWRALPNGKPVVRLI